MADKDTLIVRQSQMQRAIEFYNLMGVRPTSLQLVATADHFTQYVMNGMTKEIIEKSRRLDGMITDLLTEQNK